MNERDWTGPDQCYPDAMNAWLRANGIDPQDVPLHVPVTVHDGQIIYPRWRRDTDTLTTGGRRWEMYAAPLTVAPPAVVASAMSRLGATLSVREPHRCDGGMWCRCPTSTPCPVPPAEGGAR